MPSGTDLDALARFLMAAFQGLRLVGKVNPNRAVLDGHSDDNAAMPEIAASTADMAAIIASR